MSEYINKGNSARQKGSKKTKRVLVMLTGMLIIAVLIVVIVWAIVTRNNPLTGTWVYDEYTLYVFEKDGNGYLEVDDVRYAYTYKTSGDTLTMDFAEDIVRDCEYTFSVKNGQLTLIGGKGTDGGTYMLLKEIVPLDSI